MSSASACRALGVRLREATLRLKTEHGALIDAESGVQVGHIVVGTEDQLKAADVLQLMQPGRRYAFVHTHPEGYAFSPPDVAVLVANVPLLHVVVAVGGQGTWYFVSMAPDGTPPVPARVFSAFREQLEVLAPGYQALMQAGELTRREAQRRLTHDVWEHIAPSLHLRYDRVP